MGTRGVSVTGRGAGGTEAACRGWAILRLEYGGNEQRTEAEPRRAPAFRGWIWKKEGEKERKVSWWGESPETQGGEFPKGHSGCWWAVGWRVQGGES